MYIIYINWTSAWPLSPFNIKMPSTMQGIKDLFLNFISLFCLTSIKCMNESIVSITDIEKRLSKLNNGYIIAFLKTNSIVNLMNNSSH